MQRIIQESRMGCKPTTTTYGSTMINPRRFDHANSIHRTTQHFPSYQQGHVFSKLWVLRQRERNFVSFEIFLLMSWISAGCRVIIWGSSDSCKLYPLQTFTFSFARTKEPVSINSRYLPGEINFCIPWQLIVSSSKFCRTAQTCSRPTFPRNLISITQRQ